MDGPGRLPDFILGGAMKCGTTSLHRTLAAHPRVYLPRSEVFLFDIDDVDQNPDFLPVGRAVADDPPDYLRHRDAYLRWYRELFAGAGPDQVLGEDSTTYLASEVAPARIHDLLPQVKLLFMLRDPVDRAYSHYWHLVRTGRAAFSFEDTLRLAPENVLRRGCYRRQLSRYYDLFPSEHVKVLIFEEFTAEPHAVLDETCRFLGVPPFDAFPSESLHENPGGPLVSPRLNLLFNAVVGHRVNRHGHRVPTTGGQRQSGRSKEAVRAAARRVSLRLTRRYPPMDPRTRRVLQEVYARENEGLAELIGTDLVRHWAWLPA